MRVVLTLVLLLAPALSTAQWLHATDPGVTRWELTVFGGYRWGGEMDIAAVEGGPTAVRADVGNDSVRGAAIGVPFGADYHVELFAISQDTRLEGSSQGGGIRVEGEVAIDVLHLGLVRTWKQQGGFTTHIGFGAGITRIEPEIEGFERGDLFSVSADFGLKYPLARHFAIRLDARMLWLADDGVLERQSDVGSLPAVIDPGGMLQYDLTLGLVARW